MATTVTVKNTVEPGVIGFQAEKEPKELSILVNEAIKLNEKFVTFAEPGGGQRSVIAEQIVELLEGK